MSIATTEISDIPAALPIAETEDEREKLIEQAVSENRSADDDSPLEGDDDAEFEDVPELPKPSKKKLFVAFVCFVFLFVLLLAVLCWFFGIGVFAAKKVQAVDRTNKSGSSQSVPVTEEEKLKMALSLVAEKNPNGDVSSNGESIGSVTGDSNLSSSVDIPSTSAADLSEPIVVPDSSLEPNRSAVNAPLISVNPETRKTPNFPANEGTQNVANDVKKNPFLSQTNLTDAITPLGRSLFFGLERKENVVSNVSLQSKKQTITGLEVGKSKTNSAAAIPFGTLLPIRFLGAVFTLRSSGGLVRMELTRAISGKSYSYPAGTVLVGTLRGKEHKSPFVSVVGLIDPKTGGLVKFEGEVMGNDGASGILGRRRQIKGAWSRVLSGLREAGGLALGAVGNRRSGGTVVISDSTSKASGALSEELSGIVGGKQKSGEFIEIAAGTSGFVLVTDLPDEISNTDNLAENRKSATELDERELADLFSEGSPEKIRAALPRMTPAFRALAENVLATMEGK